VRGEEQSNPFLVVSAENGRQTTKPASDSRPVSRGHSGTLAQANAAIPFGQMRWAYRAADFLTVVA
jgi:hypothetical protein